MTANNDLQNDNITALLRKANEMIRYLNLFPESLAELHLVAPEDRTQYTRKHNSMKRKGGTSPIDYTAAELKVDLERALRRSDLAGIASAYYKLNRIVPLH